jgi:hypothetical protein
VKHIPTKPVVRQVQKGRIQKEWGCFVNEKSQLNGKGGTRGASRPWMKELSGKDFLVPKAFSISPHEARFPPGAVWVITNGLFSTREETKPKSATGAIIN